MTYDIKLEGWRAGLWIGLILTVFLNGALHMLRDMFFAVQRLFF